MRAALLIAALALAGCPAGLEEQSQISKLRVLAVRADPPELSLDPDAGLPRRGSCRCLRRNRQRGRSREANG